MIIYNITIKVDPSIQDEWLAWLKEVHIPDILNTGCFTKANILRLLETDDTDGPTYAVQYHAESKAIYNRYIEKFSVILMQKSFEKWGDHFLSFPSVLQVVN
ncbi:MAG: DUF4286 family protein [Ferruginibacter sp.]